ncbi:uncharacterized protein F4822DRAFT_150033 [Hypoxylon trugodes]|uniref:uncharacterized protein n=1 Tax=Hypoxylon trugodes TaxID=326681 RepID=UPI00219C0C28|nr:uncharacterized protein F4822DRAFT_150033 [Hypoxylon trugodes]KAI1393078.1 hypothetical protein F4822DRAFT_150033 [Hypoxylon trugodes]
MSAESPLTSVATPEPLTESRNRELPATHTGLGVAEQACKECHRRKARCDRALPTCNLCTRYRRHCLYQKHSRTPLTRKYLTEVEERLERSEALVRQLRALLPLSRNEDGTRRTTGQFSGDNFDFAQVDHQTSPTALPDPDYQSLAQPPQSTSTETFRSDISRGPSGVVVGSWKVSSINQNSTRNGDDRSPKPPPSRTHQSSSVSQTTVLESPPAMHGFDWDEQDPFVDSPTSRDTTGPSAGEGPGISDGMASLSVDEREGGYLGVASGAALLRILEPARRRSSSQATVQRPTMRFPRLEQPNPNKHITDAMIDAYFRVYHVSYPIIHEPTFRAQYSEVIPRPDGNSWLVLAYVVAAIGVFSADTQISNLDLPLFAQARSMMSFDLLEVGNMTLVQAFTLISNYQQKRNKPNSGYNHSGLAMRMAMGLGLHKEFQGWSISPLNMEMRRRVWWTLCVFEVGATITFSRPSSWPFEGVDVSLPINVNDRELTTRSPNYPPESSEITPYTAVRTQASFHIATISIYNRVISKPFPTAEELLRLDAEYLAPWVRSIPPYFSDAATIPLKFKLSHSVMRWRLRNFRIILKMYRPFVIRRALHTRDGRQEDSSAASIEAYEICLDEAKHTISSIVAYWEANEHSRLASWYALYFLFQAALIPCICLRNGPYSTEASQWRHQIAITLRTIASLASVNPSAGRCHQVISELCSRYLEPGSVAVDPGPSSTIPNNPQSTHSYQNNHSGQPKTNAVSEDTDMNEPIADSPQTQINHIYSMMWPNVTPLEAADLVMGDDAWMEFLREDGNGGEVARDWLSS